MCGMIISLEGNSRCKSIIMTGPDVTALEHAHHTRRIESILSSSLNEKHRRTVDLAVAQENERLAHRLMNARSHYSVGTFEKEWLKSERIMANISRFEHPWRSTLVSESGSDKETVALLQGSWVVEGRAESPAC